MRKNKNINKQIKLYELFKCNYTVGKRTARIPLIFNAIGYLTHTISFKIPLRVDVKLFIQVQSTLNKMFLEKKI